MSSSSIRPPGYFTEAATMSSVSVSEPRRTSSRPVRVAVIAECPLLRSGIGQALATEPEFELVDQCETVGDGIRIAYERRPDLIILSPRGGEDGLDAIPVMLSASPEARVVIIASAAEPELARAAFLAGARGYLAKGVTRDELLDALRRVAEQPVIVTKGLSIAQVANGQLSPREQQILDKIAEGRSNKEIARCLSISEKTVKQHITSLLSKLGVRNRVEAAVLVCEDGSKHEGNV